MKAIMISIKPMYVADILNGKKTIEIRKSMPKCELPIDVYIYCTSHKNYHESLYEVCEEDGGGYDVDYYNPCCREDEDEKDFLLNSQVVAKFMLNKVDCFYDFDDELCYHACLDREEMIGYLDDKVGCAWRIDDLVIFDKPRPLNDFGIEKAPQSWCYIEVELCQK